MVQLSKYFYPVNSFGAVSMADAFAKRYELHYQPKRVQIGGGVVYAQFGCLNIHAKHYKDYVLKLSLTVKNKWSAG
jgi:hypothetical protein